MKDQQSQDISGTVQSTLHYFHRNDGTEENPVQPGGSGRSAEQAMTISDARPMIQQLSLDREGFALIQHESAVANFYDPDEVRATYYPELQRLIAEVTGAEKVVIFAHDVRCAPKAGVGGVREPVFAVHNDYTLKSGPQHVHDLLPASEVAERLQRRYIELNIWRPIRGPVLDSPLAICDARSIARQDLAPVELKHEVYMVSYNPAHRWYYFPLMVPGEVILLKGFGDVTILEGCCSGWTSRV